jgi:hypothetical protein
MKLLNTITIEGSMHQNDQGTHEWGDFCITTSRWLNESTIKNLCAIHGMVGQSFSYDETKDKNNYTYKGTYDCYSD